MRLTRFTKKNLSNNQRKIRELLSRAKRLDGIGSVNDVVSLEDSIKELNDGISEDEIRAWVLFKRSVGIPMNGWEKYFVNGDYNGKVLKTLRTTEIRDTKGTIIMFAPANSMLGKLCESSSENGETYAFISQQGEERRVKKEDVTEIFVYKPKQNILDTYVKKGLLFYSVGEYLPLPLFAFGDIYNRMRTIKEEKTFISQKYGKDVYENHMKVLLDACPQKLSFNDEENMPTLYPWSDFSSETKVKKLSKDCVLSKNIDDDGISLRSLFSDYLEFISPNDIQCVHSIQLIKGVALYRQKKPNGYGDEEWERIKGEIMVEIVRLFKKFIKEWISEDGRLELTIAWNAKFNATGRIMSERVPIGFSHSRMFGNNPFSLRPAQRMGIAFMELTGSGCLSFDVGVGKTLTAISTVASALQQGKCKRPLIIVPNSTYANWIKEIVGNKYVSGVLTGCGVKVNKCYNMRGNYIPLEGDIEDGSITLATKEALTVMGFGDEFAKELREELLNILFPDKDKGLGDDDIKSIKRRLSFTEKVEALLGKANKGSFIDFDKLGFDYIVLDEAHNYRNLFSNVKVNSNKPAFGKRPTGSPSDVAIRAFVFCNYIQRKYGENVLLLTATPFTNAPLEVYSMLSLVGRRELQKRGLEDIHVFWETFIKEVYGEVVNAEQEIVDSWYIESFVNVRVLQSILFSKFLYRTGEEVNVPRPAKITIPLTKRKGTPLNEEKRVLSYLEMNGLQESNQLEINEEIDKLASRDKKDKGRGLSAMGASLRNAFSPYACSINGVSLQNAPTDYREFVENSPKIKYVCDCIKSVKDWHDERIEKMSGQVIYSGITGLGKGGDTTYLNYIKEYLEETCGFEKDLKYEYETDKKRQKFVDEVMLLTGSTSAEDRPILMDAFNAGIIKVIIGSPAIREGINLQKCATCLYILTPTWNPTDMQQLEGRIYRQGNKFQYVRIVIPLVQNSMDVFVFQKLQEKTGRVNSLWNTSERGNVLSLDSLDPEEVKLALVSDISKIALKQQRKEIEKETDKKNTLDKIIYSLADFPKLMGNYKRYKDSLVFEAKSLVSKLKYSNFSLSGKYISVNDLLNSGLSLDGDYIGTYSKTDSHKIKRVIDVYNSLREYVETNDFSNDATLYSIIAKVLNLDITHEVSTSLLEAFKYCFTEMARVEKGVLIPQGYDRNSDISSVINKIKEEAEKLDLIIEKLRSKEHYNEIYSRIEHKKQELDVVGGGVDERVAEFAKINYIMKFSFVGKAENEVVPEDMPDDQIPQPKREESKVEVLSLVRTLKNRIKILNEIK